MSSSKKGSSRKLLIVDDEVDVLDFLRIYLESLSWQVVTADSTAAAFIHLEQEQFFCIITDIAMPRMDGYEFVTAVRQRGIASQVILMTGFGYNPNHTLVKLNKTFSYPILFKPFNRKKLADLIDAAHKSYHQRPH